MECFFKKTFAKTAVWGTPCVPESNKSIWWCQLTPKRVQSQLNDLVQPVIENHSSVHCDNERLSKKHIKATNKSLSKSIKNIYQSSTKINYNNFLNYINVLLL